MSRSSVLSTPAALRWLDAPASTHGVRCVAPDGSASVHPYSELADRARRIAAGLVAAGVPPQGRVAVVPGARQDFVSAFFAVLRAGATTVVLPPPLPAPSASYTDHLATTLAVARPSLVVADPEVRDAVAAALSAGGRPCAVRTPDELAAAGAGAGPADGERAPAGIALVQFSSGSGGPPRGVAVPFPALEANAEAIRSWLRITPRDAWASWLPLHHDMGLIGCLVAPVVGGNPVTLCRPEDFVRDPLPYLRCFGPGWATITAMPGFGLDRILRRVPPEALAGLDLSGWRAAVVGAERLEPELLDRFEALLRPHGLGSTVLLPAYGLAEATLAVTGTPVGRGRRTAPGPDGRRVQGCGRPVGDLTVTIVDPDDGAAVPDGTVGDIHVRGSSVAAGYVGAPRGADLARGVLRTGDAGFVRDGELYVLGRLGDGVKVRGATLFAEDVEADIARAGPPAHRVAVVLGQAPDATAVAVVVIERADGSELDAAAAVLRRCAGGLRHVLVAAAPGAIPRTPSGKRRRRALWRAYTAGLLDAHVRSAPPVRCDQEEGTARDGH